MKAFDQINSVDGTTCTGMCAASRKTGQTAVSRDDDAAHCQPVQQGFARDAAGRPRLYKARPLRRAQTARSARVAADDVGIEEAIAALAREPGAALVAMADIFTALHRKLIIQLATN